MKMKKILIPLLVILCLLCMLALVACENTNTPAESGGVDATDGDDTEQACSHEYTDVVTVPTCTAVGYTTHTCSKCGDVKKDAEVAATGHSYTAVVTPPTCDSDGYTTHTCSACGDYYKDTPVKLSGHVWDYAHATGSSVSCTICQKNYSWTTSVTFTYEEYDGDWSDDAGYTITGCSGTLPETLKIPAVYNGKPVMAIGERAFRRSYNSGLEVRTLHSLIVPDTVIDLGNGSFIDCDYLTSVSLPNTLRHIGSNPFAGTPYETAKTKDDTYGLATTVNPFIINGIYLITPLIGSATEYKVPEGIELIADSAFHVMTSNCIRLETITLPKTLRYLGSEVFVGCVNLQTLNIHKGLLAFADDPMGPNHTKVKRINFEGTQAEWRAIENWESFGFTQYFKYNKTIAE